MKTLAYFLLFFTSSLVSAQKNPVQKLNDQAMEIYRNDTKEALSLLGEAGNIAENKTDKDLTQNNLGIVYRFLGNCEEAKKYSVKASSSKDLKIQASAYNNLGACHRISGELETSIDFYIKALKNYEKLKEDKEYATVSNNIGIVYNQLGLYDKAKEYHEYAIKAFTKIDYKKGLSESYNNYAMVLVNEEDLGGALKYFQKSLMIEEELHDKKGISESLNNVAGVYFYQGKAEEAIQIFKEVLEIEKSIENSQGIASTYNNIAQVLIENGTYSNAKSYIDSAYYFAKHNYIADDYLASLENYIAYYQNQQEYKAANGYYEIYFHAFDSINKKNNLSQLTEVETKYQTEKKEKQILKQRAEIAENKLSLERKNLWMTVFVALALLTGLIGYFLYRTQKIKNTQLQKENALKDALIKIETRNKIQEERLRISRDLHDNIGSQLTFIISSLDNLKFQIKNENPEAGNRIENINQFTRTTIAELRDTIWAMNKENISISDLIVRISNFIEHAKMASPNIDFKVETGSQLDESHTFSAFEGINIYRVIQESINNSIKHSGANQIHLKFQQENQRFQILMTDNGKGFDEKNLNLGNGLNNMHKRVAEIGGELNLESGPGRGTKLKVII